jgi:hypothetical protein
LKTIALAWIAIVSVACNKSQEGLGNELAASATTANVATPAATVTVAPGAVTINQGAAAAPKSVVVGNHAGGAVQVQAGGKKVEVAANNGTVDVSGLAGLAKAAAVTGAAAPNPAPAVNPPAAPKAGPCAQLAAKCPKCTLPMLKQTCNLAVSSGDAASCQNGLNDRDVQANCK